MLQSISEDQERQVLDHLQKIGVAFRRFEHPPVATVAEAEKYWQSLRGVHCKNLFLRNWKGNRHYLLIAAASKKLDLKNLSRLINEDRLSFASPERLKKFLGLEPGSVSPFGLINDLNKEVKVIIDNQLKNSDFLGFHPNINTSTLEISGKDFLKFLESCGQKVIWLSI